MGAKPFTAAFTLHNGDALEVLASMPDASIDAIVTDPPYELSFMCRAWDGTGIAYNTDLWQECLRVLKPGGHLLSFGGTRTYHRMAVAIEDAGFEIRDSIHWTYGSGFPKSLDVSKAIDKAAGAQRTEGAREWRGGQRQSVVMGNNLGTQTLTKYDTPATPEAQQWQGWGTALKPSHEPIVLARKPLSGTVAANVLEHGTGALNIDGCRVGTGGGTAWQYSGDKADVGQFGGGIKDGVIAPLNAGRWTANTILTHAAECRATGETVVDKAGDPNRFAKTDGGSFASFGEHPPVSTLKDRDVSVYRCAPGCPVAELDTQNGGASRYFTANEWTDADNIAPFLYQAKASKRERNAGLANTNHHPTVKPVALMRHLIRLVTPPAGVVLDPFTGSGSTGVAAIHEGVEFVGIEREAEYLPIITARLQHALTVTGTPPQPELPLAS